MRKKNVGAARRPMTLHQRWSSTKKYPKCPIETKMIAAVFSQSVSSTGGDTLFERVAASTSRGSPLSFLSRVTVQSPQQYSHRRGNWAPRRRSGGGLTGQVLLVFRASATGNEPYFPWSCPPKGWDRALDLRRSSPMHSRQGRRGLRELDRRLDQKDVMDRMQIQVSWSGE